MVGDMMAGTAKKLSVVCLWSMTGSPGEPRLARADMEVRQATQECASCA